MLKKIEIRARELSVLFLLFVLVFDLNENGKKVGLVLTIEAVGIATAGP